MKINAISVLYSTHLFLVFKLGLDLGLDLDFKSISNVGMDLDFQSFFRAGLEFGFCGLDFGFFPTFAHSKLQWRITQPILRRIWQICSSTVFNVKTLFQRQKINIWAPVYDIMDIVFQIWIYFHGETARKWGPLDYFVQPWTVEGIHTKIGTCLAWGRLPQGKQRCHQRVLRPISQHYGLILSIDNPFSRSVADLPLSLREAFSERGQEN